LAAAGASSLSLMKGEGGCRRSHRSSMWPSPGFSVSLPEDSHSRYADAYATETNWCLSTGLSTAVFQRDRQELENDLTSSRWLCGTVFWSSRIFLATWH